MLKHNVKKVSDLSGSALDDYVAKLSEMGSAVARTGKPKCQAPDDGIVNQYQEPLEIQYSLRAYSATMVAWDYSTMNAGNY